jgi:Bacterial PH domain
VIEQAGLELMSTSATSFPLAPMSPLIKTLTVLLFAIPIVFALLALQGQRVLSIPALGVITVYVWVWLRFRPTRFVVHPDRLEVRWPLKRREIRREEITDVRLIDNDMLRRGAGWCARVGAGGLWGGFGWLWTQRRGIVQMYVSRTDEFVWIERGGERPWLITPSEPAAFVRALSAGTSLSGSDR